jgi:ribosomal protein S18 acetylase RimI-like enzyme
VNDPDPLPRIEAFARELDRRCATLVEPSPFGVAYLGLDHRRRYDSSFLVVERVPGDVGADAIAAETDRILDGHGLEHREVLVVDDATGRRFAPRFGELGWSADRLVTMVRARTADPRQPTDVRQVGYVEARPLIDEVLRREPYGDDAETVRQLSEFRLVLEREAGARFFVADADGRPASVCERYAIDGVAQIEDVATLEEFRGRGLASAVVLAAAADAAERGCDVVFLVADEEDWPKELYRRLGFDPIAWSWSFLRMPDGDGGQRT